MKKAIIVHCWDGVPDSRWYPETKKELEELGFSVQVPAMPDTDNPSMKTWVPTLSAAVGEPDADTFLIGHSIGCATIMRYLEALPGGQKVGGVIFVAGFTDNLEFEELSNFFETPIDFEKVKTKANKFVAIQSDNDPYVPIKHGDILKRQLGAELIVKHNAGHFSKEDGCTSLADVAEAIQRIAI